MGSGVIRARPDPIFTEKLIYCFYGRPAYRVHRTGQSDSEMQLVAVVLRPRMIENSHRVFPFDTGAFHMGLYRDSLHPQVKVGDFECPPFGESAQSIVSEFFGQNEAYLDNHLITDQTERDPLDLEGKEYAKLISNAQDDRASSIEVQFSTDILVMPNSIEIIILPDTLAYSDGVRKFLQGRSIPWLVYPADTRGRDGTTTLTIKALLRQHYRTQGYLRVADYELADEFGEAS
jgi:hypothetical protein